MVYEKSSNRDSAIYTKASDLQQLEKELEILRQKRRSRRCSQNIPATTIKLPNTKVEEPPKDSPLSTILLSSSPKKNDSDAVKKEIVSSPIRQETPSSPEIKSDLVLSDNLPKVTSEYSQTDTPKPPIKPKRHENRPDPIVTKIDKNEPSANQQKEQPQEPHSILLKKLIHASDKKDNRKLSRLKQNNTRESISNEHDLTEELLLTAFNNLNSQSTPVIGQSKNTNSDIAAPSPALKTTAPKPSFSSLPAPTEKVPTWKKQSSLKKLQLSKGKVSTVINALENGKSTTTYRINKQTKPPRPLAEYKLPSPYHQQPFNFGILHAIEKPATTLRSPSDLSALQQPQQTPRQDKVSNSQTTIQLPSPHSNTLSTDTALEPRRKQPSANKRRNETKKPQTTQQLVLNSNASTHPEVAGTIQRPVPLYTPQLSPLAGECDHNLTNLLPSASKPKPLIISTVSTSEHESSSPPPALLSKKSIDLPPTPPLKSENRPPVKVQCPPTPPPHQWHIHKRLPANLTNNSNNSQAYRQLRVININEDIDTTTMESSNVNVSTGQTQQNRRRQRRNDSFAVVAGAAADDDSLSDSNKNHSFDANDDNTHGSTTSSAISQTNQQRKRYSHNSSNDHLRHMDMAHYEERQARQKKVSFSSVLTTIPAPTPSTTMLSLDDYPENTRGFWEAFSAEMGHQHHHLHQHHQQTLLEKLEDMKRQQQGSRDRTPPYKMDTDSDPITVSVGNNKLINKLFLNTKLSSRNDQQQSKKIVPSSTWWKGNSNTDLLVTKKTKKRNNKNNIVDLDDRPVSQSPPLDHPTKHRPKKPSSFRKKSSSTVIPEPQWRQRVPVPSSNHHPLPIV